MEFKPNPWVPGGFVQTILGTWNFSNVEDRGQRHEFAFNDGDKTSYIEHGEGPVVVLLHGLGGNAWSSYSKRLNLKFAAQGFRVIRFNHRGCDPKLSSKRIYHAAAYEDLDEFLSFIAHKHHIHTVIGFSLSGTILLNLLRRKHIAADHAITVCAPLDLEASSARLSRFSNLLIDQYFCRHLKRHALKHGFARKDEFPKFFNLRKFDDFFTAKQAGFRNREEYYRAASSFKEIHKITNKLTMIASIDDPIVESRSYSEVKKRTKHQVIMTERGGHMGYLGHRKNGEVRWLDAALLKLATNNAHPPSRASE